MKAQLSRYITILFLIAATFAFVAALSATAVGCGDEESDSEEESATGVDGGDNSSSFPGQGNAGSAGSTTGDTTNADESPGSADTDASIEESDGGTEESGDDDDSESDDDGDDSESDDDGDDSESDDDGGDDGNSESDDDGDDSESDEDSGDTDDSVECTEDDLSQCSDFDITFGVFPMDVCCTEDGFCGTSFSIGPDFTTDCITDQFQEPLITEDCEECAQTNCESEYSDCHDDPACAAVSDCIVSCTGLTECASCLIDNAQGLSAYLSLASCALTECGETCADRFADVLPPGWIEILVGAGGGFPGGFPGGVPGGFPGGVPGGFPGASTN